MSNDSTKFHWENIYTQKLPQDVSWFQKEPAISLKIIQRISDKNARIIDVGGGASVLVDHLLKLGYSNLAVLDISGKAIEHAKKRLHDQAIKVKWFEKDITEFIPSEVLTKYNYPILKNALTQIHFPENPKQANQARDRLAFDELLLLQLKSKQRKQEWEKDIKGSRL